MKRSSLKCTALVLTMSLLIGMCGCDDSDTSGTGDSSSTSGSTQVTESGETSGTSTTSVTTTEESTVPTVDITGDEIPKLKENAETLSLAFQTLDKDTAGALCTPEGNALNSVVVPDGAADLYLLYFSKTNFNVTTARGQEDIGGNARYEITMVDLTGILAGLGEVYTYGDVYNAVYAATDANMVTKEVIVPFAYDANSQMYLATDTSSIVNEFMAQLSQIVLRQYISQDEVNLATVALMSAIGSNDVATANALAGGTIMSDWGIQAPLYVRLYLNASYEVEIVTPGVNATAVTIHAHFHDANEAVNDMVWNHAAELAPAFGDYVCSLIKETPEQGINYELLADVFEKSLLNASVINVDVPCTITKNPDGTLVFEPSVAPLVFAFDPDVHWRGWLPSEILLPTADYLYQNGAISSFERDWIYVERTSILVPIDWTADPNYGITDVVTYYYDDGSRKVTSGLKANHYALDFGLVLTQPFPAGSTLYVDYYINGKLDFQGATTLSDNPKTVQPFGAHHKNKTPYPSGSYQVVVYAPDDSSRTQVICTITFAFP